MENKIVPNLWFDGQAEDAANFYISVFPNSRIVSLAHYPENSPGPAGTVMTVEFELDGQRFVAINGGPEFTFSEAVSFLINCDTQEEIDRYWELLTEGGDEGPCGWCQDRLACPGRSRRRVWTRSSATPTRAAPSARCRRC